MRISIIYSILLLFLGTALLAQDEVIKDTYQDRMNGQTTVIIKDSTSTDQDVLNQLDLDQYTVGQEVRITEDMIAELNRRERMKALGYDPQAASEKETEDSEVEVLEVGVITPTSHLEVSSDENEEMIPIGSEKGGEEIFKRKNPAPAKFLELIESEEYKKKLEELKAKGELIFA